MLINEITNNAIYEGVNDPHIFKALFVIGSGGAGKSTIAKYLTSGTGMKIVDVDKYYEFLKKDNSIETSNDSLNKDAAWNRAKSLNTTQLASYVSGRLGIALINTGKNYSKMKQVVATLEQIGYDVAILYVRAVKDDVHLRNSSRRRKVDQIELSTIYNEVAQNAIIYKLEFSEQFVIYDNVTSEKITKNFDNTECFHSNESRQTLNKWFSKWIASTPAAVGKWKNSEEKNEKTSNVNKINQHKAEITHNLRVK